MVVRLKSGSSLTLWLMWSRGPPCDPSAITSQCKVSPCETNASIQVRTKASYVRRVDIAFVFTFYRTDVVMESPAESQAERLPIPLVTDQRTGSNYGAAGNRITINGNARVLCLDVR